MMLPIQRRYLQVSREFSRLHQQERAIAVRTGLSVTLAHSNSYRRLAKERSRLAHEMARRGIELPEERAGAESNDHP